VLEVPDGTTAVAGLRSTGPLHAIDTGGVRLRLHLPATCREAHLKLVFTARR
jgi:hypothetical protein